MQQIKTVNDLRKILAEEINNIRTGKTTAANVNAIVNATGKILTTVKMEIEYNKLLGKTPNIDFITGGDTPATTPAPSKIKKISQK